MKNKIIAIVIGIVIIGGGAFYGGMKYQQNVNSQAISAQRAQRTANFGAGQGNNQLMAGGAGGFTGGEIIGKDDKSITVKSNDGSSKIIFFSNTTRIMKSAESSSGDLVAGEQISVNGTANQDGSITAQSIQINKPIPSQ